MLEEIFRRSRVRQRIRQNPRGQLLEQFADYLHERGHQPSPLHQYMFAAEHFTQWLGRGKLNRRAVERFHQEHLPACQCTTPATRNPTTVRAALNRLLEMAGVDCPPRFSSSPVERLLTQYASHLAQVQGLAPSTVHYRSRYARKMFAHLRTEKRSDIRAWTVDQVVQFVTHEGRQCRPSSGQVLASSIRSFLRFLLLHRLIQSDLAAAVPSFANWRLASTPSTVGNQLLEHLVKLPCRPTPNELRDHAIALCLVELGLRASDITGIELDRLDLKAQVLHLRRRKQRSRVAMPVSRRLAGAIGAYLQQGRPACKTPLLFVTHRAPQGKPMTPIGVRGVVIRLAAKAGLSSQIRGTHVIRHSVASRWLQSGATLKQIADLLGHRSLDTTTIYTKVDLKTLAQVALPWPTTREVQP